ncbi:acyl-CoA dehydrogenase family protein [Actibacterium lipolyticum]|uniref:Acyl-CoA dehydrogenase n=1 Tax=Actibacterium lipolyticum TaxID=1524263 RepID=A0A238JJQ8_9RHOB|nr:acyl-CoA dehydrogenase family protein [Actibacterium lipolyticum]SMX30643.1 Acyl-CoA dehydrogenase [Actibacterium lipolyticum]
MTQFNAPVKDILFSLEHVACAGDLPDWDGELAGEIVQHFTSFAEAEIAPTDAAGDAQGCRIENGRVRMPDGFGAAYRQLADQGWQGLCAPEEHGGQGMNSAVGAAVSEVFSGANHSLQMVTGLVPGAVRTLLDFGDAAQQAHYIPLLTSGAWLSTMCLTESGAGSDLSAIRTRAVDGPDGWRVEGEKIFISGGDQDLSDGILHLVLARTGDAGSGVRGLSLFLCPSQSEGGDRNAITVERIEEKMGLHASPTCQVVFSNAKAELLGELGCGLKAMFTMMNHARLDVALQGVAHAARATEISRSYAAERVQGRGADGASVTIDKHPAVARMIDEQDALTLGARALCHIALVALEKGDDVALVDFLTPICKAFATDAGIRAADSAIQVLGGYGYLTEYCADQNYRDARITAIYEGTNEIHAITLASRLLRHNGGAAADAFERFVETEAAQGDAALTACLPNWKRAREVVVASEAPAALADDFMKLTSQVAYLTAWSRIGRAAEKSDDPQRLKQLHKHVSRQSSAMVHYHFELIAG